MTTRIASCCAVTLLALVVNLTAQGGRVAVTPEDRQLIEDLVIANRILANEGILDGLGHVSVRPIATRSPCCPVTKPQDWSRPTM